MNRAIALDPIDKELLHRLQQDARTTNLALSKAVDLSPASTLERVRKLEQQRYIRAYHAQLDRAKLGLGIEAFVQVKLQTLHQASVNSFQEAIAQIDEVIVCRQGIGEADFLLTIVTTDLPAYQRLLLGPIGQIKAIQWMKTFLVTHTGKETGIIL